MRGRGPPPGARYCDFKTLLGFLPLFRGKPKTIYKIYHDAGRGWDLKKVYRYLRYSAGLGLLEIDHVGESGFLPPKWWRLTQRGHELLDWNLKHRVLGAPRQPVARSN